MGRGAGAATSRPLDKSQADGHPPSTMPPTAEFRCTDDDCPLDMLEAHYTYDMPDDVGVDDFECPYCGGATLDAIEV